MSTMSNTGEEEEEEEDGSPAADGAEAELVGVRGAEEGMRGEGREEEEEEDASIIFRPLLALLLLFSPPDADITPITPSADADVGREDVEVWLYGEGECPEDKLPTLALLPIPTLVLEREGGRG